MRLFLAVARTGSISGAARQLGVQHSTVSRRTRQLEKKLGTRLIERKKTGYELTAAGEKIRLAAERMESEILSVDGSVLGRDTRLVGPLRVTAINNMASSLLMPMFAAFSRKHPEVELHIIVSNTDASLAQREADVAIRLTNRPTDTLIGTRAVTVASTVYGSRDYRAKIRKQGAQPQWLGVECCHFHRTWTKQQCDGQTHMFYSDDTVLTLAALKQGLGISWLPCFMGDAEPQLERVREPDAAHDLGLWILIHPDLKRTARVLAFREFILDAIKQQSAVFEGRLTGN